MNARKLTTLAMATFLLALSAQASDHDDTALLVKAVRHEARITDLHAFVRGSDLVLSLSLNPAIPPSAVEYVFPPDLELKIHIDNDSEVAFDDPEDLARYGGTIVHPSKIKADIVFQLNFDQDGTPVLDVHDPSKGPKAKPVRVEPEMFVGLRDDPFIRGPRIGRNVATIVLQMPLRDVLKHQSTLLLWATAQIGNIHGTCHDLVGRSLRSQLVPNELLNTLPPNRHEAELGIAPDVMIFDTSRPAEFPNGRELTDDVVDLVADPGVLSSDAPFPAENDVPFLEVFPYLAPPHPAP